MESSDFIVLVVLRFHMCDKGTEYTHTPCQRQFPALPLHWRMEPRNGMRDVPVLANSCESIIMSYSKFLLNDLKTVFFFLRQSFQPGTEQGWHIVALLKNKIK